MESCTSSPDPRRSRSGSASGPGSLMSRTSKWDKEGGLLTWDADGLSSATSTRCSLGSCAGSSGPWTMVVGGLCFSPCAGSCGVTPASARSCGSPLVLQNRQGDLLRVVALHNSAPLASELEESSSVVGCGSVELVPDFYLSRADQDRVVRVFVKHMEEMSGAQLPAGPSLWTPWLRGQLEGATARLQRQGVQDDVVPVISTLLRSMQCGHEAAHLEYLLRWADHRGSDVLLFSGTVLNGTTQRAPYPAFCWDWQSVQQYQWRAAQHINVLELTTLLNYLRMRTATGEVANMRIFHFFDSLVAASVAAKGRSSSFVLNRICRRTAAVCLSPSTFVVSLWTISSWQPSDSASRVAVRRDDG